MKFCVIGGGKSEIHRCKVLSIAAIEFTVEWEYVREVIMWGSETVDFQGACMARSAWKLEPPLFVMLQSLFDFVSSTSLSAVLHATRLSSLSLTCCHYLVICLSVCPA